MEINRKDVKIGEIYIGLSDLYLTIENIVDINDGVIYTQCYYGVLGAPSFEPRFILNILADKYKLYNFNDCLNEKDLKPHLDLLKKLIEYFESFPENKVYSRKRKLKLLEEYGR